MIKKIAFTCLALLLVLGAIAGVKALQIRALIASGKTMVPPPDAVTTAVVRAETWETTLNAIGSFAAVQGVTLSAEVAGTVSKIDFESGASVAAGAVLVELDTSVEQAQLRSAEATAELARLNLTRARELRLQNTNSQADLDSADAQAKQAAAQADNLRAILAKKLIAAPFTGRAGIRLVNVGQFLPVGTPIVSIQALDPIFLNLSLPQQQLGQVSEGLTARVVTDAYPGQLFEGKVTAINPDLDPTTRSVKLQVTLPNADSRLRPGMFGTVSIVLPVTAPVIIIPATAVLYAPYGDTVFVVEEKKNEATGETQQVVRQQFVRLGTARGDFVAVTSGLKVGDTVVSAGVFKLRNGSTVSVKNEFAPNAQLAPKPSDS
ncbi:MAG: efflux RND transporter periplasmic adaptor subunit [Opitutus sp.]|nr:efflux RND transporter periplasmic adaptor subunit [Opitutus sp.]MCS6248066.1 efflux RND transporter periplasmic adaptor subunit [Opitutus sp.]MCS6275208.1 efflux RND transporter periplasmic adaptor subunit [Opitutus sp.]MCS6278199.1 efflux RND transporter periplasmic adaptor subunit [Opitutus sp.]MCS6299309.1 efflux RND transporter periplasmic adaptor subunit [Opitutus sp.]